MSPSASLDALKTDLTSELGAGNGYTAGGMDIQNTTSRAAGVTTVTATDCVWTASGAVGRSVCRRVQRHGVHAVCEAAHCLLGLRIAD